MSLKQSNRISYIIVAMMVILFNIRYLNEKMFTIHAWANYDRYALVQGFIDNDFDFFKPETYVLNKQFPDDFDVPQKQAITSVDFPVTEYLVALLSKITTIDVFIVFKLLMLIYAVFGGIYLFKIADLILDNKWKSYIFISLALSSPVLIYYQGGFLPTIPALTFTIIGIYYYLKYFIGDKNKDYNIAFLFLTLGVLVRLSFLIVLLSLVVLDLFQNILKKEIKVKKVFIPILSFLFILIYWFYNEYLRETYGSMFLGQIQFPRDFNQLFYDISMIFKNWILEYFSIFHYAIIVILIAVFLIQNYQRISKINILWIFESILVLFELIFVFAMLNQFVDHDYYFLDSFYLPVVMFLLLLLKNISIGERTSKLMLIFLIAFPVMIYAINIQINRHDYRDNKDCDIIKSFSESEEYFDSLGISKESKILVLDASGPNIPFAFLGRKGYALLNTSAENIGRSLSWNYDYIVFQNDYFISDIYNNFPDIINRIDVLGTNNKITVCELSDSIYNRSIIEFASKFGYKTNGEYHTGFEYGEEIGWENYLLNSDYSYAGEYSSLIDKNSEYSLSYTFNSELVDGKIPYVIVSSHILKTEDKPILLVFSVSDSKGENKFYKAYDINNIIKDSMKWQETNFICKFPLITEGDKMNIYFWNLNKTEIYIDELNIKIF
ncbi:MAG: hypothetical protein R2771_03570 [Saprospiraceae bacterium]